MRSLGWAQIQCGWSPYIKGEIWTQWHIWGEHHVNIKKANCKPRREASARKKKKKILWMPWSQSSSFQNCEKTSVVYGSLLYSMLSCFGCFWLFATLWTVACHAPRSMGFSKNEYRTGLPCHPPGDLHDPGIKPTSLMSPALAKGFFTTSTTWEAQQIRTLV